LEVLDDRRSSSSFSNYAQEHIDAIQHPFQTVGRERYDRVAAALAVEPREPFLDRRVVELCVRLPGGQKLSGGWPKAILRRATAGLLPDQVRWRRGHEHLGWSFTESLMVGMRQQMRCTLTCASHMIASYADLSHLPIAPDSFFWWGDAKEAEQVYDAAHLAAWLVRNAERPSSTGRIWSNRS
jgi:asparagine synthase (glutamine-hydrolysing)